MRSISAVTATNSACKTACSCWPGSTLIFFPSDCSTTRNTELIIMRRSLADNFLLSIAVFMCSAMYLESRPTASNCASSSSEPRWWLIASAKHLSSDAVARAPWIEPGSFPVIRLPNSRMRRTPLNSSICSLTSDIRSPSRVRQATALLGGTNTARRAGTACA